LAQAAPAAYADNLPPELQPSDFNSFDPEQAALGQLLFYDPILSGNQNISCATCHNPDFGSADGLPLGIGEGGIGIGTARSAGVGPSRIIKRIPRNAPGLWNIGATDIKFMFLDGRVSVSDIYDNGFDTPAGEWLPEGLSGLLAAQALFPMAAQFEMAGDPLENEVAGAAYDRIDAVWPILAKRVRNIPEYADMFIAAFDDVNSAEDITIAHIANAIAAFEGLEWQSFDSPFDAWLAGDETALTPVQARGAGLFFGAAKCADCHSGPLFTDQGFYALGLPNFGPGKTRRWDPVLRDVGRMAASDRLEDAYRFRTPGLRNVSLTAPYGHNGAYASLEGIVRHHLDPAASLAAWRPELVDLPKAPWLSASDFLALDDAIEQARLAAKFDLAPNRLSDAEVAALVAFLESLTGVNSVSGRLGKPESVPSGLRVE